MELVPEVSTDSRWCLDQIDLGRAVNVGNFGTIGCESHVDKAKVVRTSLAADFCNLYGLTLSDTDSN